MKLAIIFEAYYFVSFSRMVFVGFSLQDDNFHRIADGVKKAFKGLLIQSHAFTKLPKPHERNRGRGSFKTTSLLATNP